MTRAEAIQTLQANAKLLHFEHPHLGIKEAIEVVIEALSRTSLPSGLDEAAEQYADYNSRRWHEDGDVYYDHSKILEAFKAGAEWMTRRGETIEGEVMKDIKNNLVVIAKGFSGKNAVFGDKVTVQIRKK